MKESTNPQKKIKMKIYDSDFCIDQELKELNTTQENEAKWNLFAKIIKKSALKVMFDKYDSLQELALLSKHLNYFLYIMQYRAEMTDLLVQYDYDGTVSLSFNMIEDPKFLLKVFVLLKKDENLYSLGGLEYMLNPNHKIHQSIKQAVPLAQEVLEKVFDMFSQIISDSCTYPLTPTAIMNDTKANGMSSVQVEEYKQYIEFIEKLKKNSKQVLLLNKDEEVMIDHLISDLNFAHSDPTMVTSISRVPESEEFVGPLLDFYQEVVMVIVRETKTAEGVEFLYHFYFLEYYKHSSNNSEFCVLLKIHKQIETIKCNWEEVKNLEHQKVVIQ